MHVWEILIAGLVYSGFVFYLGFAYGGKLKADAQAELAALRKQAATSIDQAAKKISG